MHVQFLSSLEGPGVQGADTLLWILIPWDNAGGARKIFLGLGVILMYGSASCGNGFTLAGGAGGFSRMLDRGTC